MTTLNRTARRLTTRAALCVALMPAAAAGGLAAAQPAAADSFGCDNFHNVCIGLTGGAGGTVTITASTNGTPFFGSFSVSGPDGLTRESGNEYWDPASHASTSWEIGNAASGEYCVTGTGADGSNQGRACNKVS